MAHDGAPFCDDQLLLARRLIEAGVRVVIFCACIRACIRYMGVGAT
jgi:hypothetical protein